ARRRPVGARRRTRCGVFARDRRVRTGIYHGNAFAGRIAVRRADRTHCRCPRRNVRTVLKLSEALAGWQPTQNGSPADPLSLPEAGWEQIVGSKVAQNSRPTRIAGGTLTITTRSSAWSHQLSLLSEHVLHAVAVRLPSAGIREIRFRVGRIADSRRPQ